MEDFLSKGNEKKILKLAVEKISSKNYNPRKEGLIQANIDSLLESNGEYPPIHLGFLNGELIVVDGYHRLEATKQLGLETIECYVTSYATEELLQTDAVNENIIHGVRLGDYDISASIYELYLNVTSKKPLTNLTQFLSYFKMSERRAKQLLFWSILHKGVLEDSVTKIEKSSIAEEILTAFANKYNFNFLLGDIEENNKILIQEFFEKYCEAPREVVREALRAMREGKEVEKDEIEVALQTRKEKLKEVEKKIVNSTPASSDPEIDTKRIISEKSFDETIESNPYIEDLINQKEEIVQEIGNNTTPIDNSKTLFSKNLEALEMTVMRLRMYQRKNPAHISHDILQKIISLQDVLQEVVDQTNEYYLEQEEKKNVV